MWAQIFRSGSGAASEDLIEEIVDEGEIKPDTDGQPTNPNVAAELGRFVSARDPLDPTESAVVLGDRTRRAIRREPL